MADAFTDSVPTNGKNSAGLAFASLILGCISSIAVFLYINLYLSLASGMLAVIGCILGGIHLRKQKAFRTMAKWGVGLSIVGSLRILLFMIVMGFIGFFGGYGQKDKSDDEMIQNFIRHRSEFEKLLEMVHTDKYLQRVDDNWTYPKDPMTIGVTPERITEYRKLFATCGIPHGFEAFHRDEKILFIANTTGLVTGGSAKSYVYRLNSPPKEETVESIDTYHRKDTRSYTIYRQIEDKWYLCYEYDD